MTSPKSPRMQFIKKIIISILTWESRLIVKKYRPFIVAVTGSVGKTSTKDAIYCVLKNSGKYVRKSEKSLNSDIGLPLTIIGVPTAWRSVRGWMSNIGEGIRLLAGKQEYPDCLVLEIGADHPGDIRSVARWLQIDVAVITKVSDMPVHVELFSSPEEVLEEKSALADAVKSGGFLLLFADDVKVLSIAERVKGRHVKIVTFGASPFAQVRGSQEVVTYEDEGGRVPSGMSFKLDQDGNSVPMRVKGVLGRSYMYPLLAAAAAGRARGMSSGAVIAALGTYEAPKGRMNIIPGINGSTLIDDSYNSSPDAAMSALEALKTLEVAGNKVAALGDMMELGQYSSEEHSRVGREAASVVSRLLTVGQRSRSTASAAVEAGLPSESVKFFDSAVEAGEYAKSTVREGDIVLIKGSQSMRMERAVALLMREPQKAAELLVRQDKEWLEKK